MRALRVVMLNYLVSIVGEGFELAIHTLYTKYTYAGLPMVIQLVYQ